MLRRLSLSCGLVLVVAGGGRAAIWPEEFYGFKRISIERQAPGKGAVWEELGFEEGEAATYALESEKFTARAWRFADSTSAMAAYLWMRPANGRASELAELATEWDGGVLLCYGNYVFRFEGRKPTADELVGMYLVIPMFETGPLPTFPSFLPEENRIAGTERFVIGPASLEEFGPAVPPSVVGFHYGVEGVVARYKSPKGDLEMALFSYPTPHIARERLVEFRMLSGSIVKRSGPLVAVIRGAPDADEAERLLAKVNYRANITWDQFTSDAGLSLAEFILTAFALIGLLLLFALVLGVLFGWFRFLRFWRKVGEEDPMILLHLGDR